MAKVVARWRGEKVAFQVEPASGHDLISDADPDLGQDLGLRPTEMMLGALAACTGINAVLLLQKFRQPLVSLTIEVDGEQEPEWPKRYTQIRLTFAPTWDGDPDPALVDKALDLAVNRYCPVEATLTSGVAVEVRRREPVP